MVKAGILIEVTPEMPTLEWLNSFVIVKKPNGSLRVCLDPMDLNKHYLTHLQHENFRENH